MGGKTKILAQRKKHTGVCASALLEKGRAVLTHGLMQHCGDGR